MKPTSFEYFAPSSLDEALALLSQYGDEGKALAGGQSLVPLMNFRLACYPAIIDLNTIASLAYIRAENGQGIRIGSLTRQRALERSMKSTMLNPLLADVLPLIGHPQIRNRGTIGGSIVHADPSAELPAALLLLDGTVTVRSAEGERVIGASDFFIGYFTTDVRAYEIVTEVKFPAWTPSDGWAALEVARRQGDFALVGVLCRVATGTDGTVTHARAAFFGVGPTPVLAHQVSDIVGTKLDDSLADVARAAAEHLEPIPDIHASADYRRYVAGVLLRRALLTAHSRAQTLLPGAKDD